MNWNGKKQSARKTYPILKLNTGKWNMEMEPK